PDGRSIRLLRRGARKGAIRPGGALPIATDAGDFVDDPPLAWQGEGRSRAVVGARYRLEPRADGALAIGIDLEGRDRTRALVVDPVTTIYAGPACGGGAVA